ncbi:aldehyde dehydrogenase (NADP(+)) [Prosthecobacter vanneervenii]|uniref:NADP-dependent aldehyde dehydrogenase n=1 Tax=Prosthecobacter vanneervenii TaxID=48466 RepID=A0A7W8DI57_9BACT|nr:aldehyde dehydrogenase (NADP(+)) [Prosthecobacter vanneervenii]MBB5030590.1 NADP-dependent aldehyde dehydrogenase [Prosthecobacter vanneervenii]
MTLTGHHLIAGREAAPHGHFFHAFNPTTGAQLEPVFGDATHAEADEALQAADAAFDALRTATPETRAKLLDTIAEEITALGDALLERAHAECALPMARLTGERGRAIGQLKLFAALIREGSWAQPSVDHAIPDRQPLPKPDVRRVLLPIGPVVVFGASNFPFAIGVIGTDTVCALASGCPVVVKGHPAHPGTCEMLSRAVLAALHKVGLPAGCFSLVHGKGNDIGTTLTKHPLTQAVAFTGSLRGGRALMDVAAARAHPIPVYAEMGSVNPVYVLPGALKERAAKIAEAYIGSVTMGVGQFCTNPAVVLGLKSDGLKEFISSASSFAAKVAPQTMLHRGICEAYDAGTAVWQTIDGLELAGQSEAPASEEASQAACRIFTTTIDVLESNAELRREVFGPCSIITECATLDDMLRYTAGLEGQLTATIQGTEQDLRDYAPLIRALERKVGRIIFNGFPTGIEVCPSMHHGGPYPAASHSFFTSIGTGSIYRFVRPVCYQGFPEEALPELIKDANPRGAMRIVDGVLTR